MNKISYTGYRFPPEIIHQAIWLYLQFTLSLRDVENLLAERGIGLSYESFRRWVNHFGPLVTADLRKRRPRPHPCVPTSSTNNPLPKLPDSSAIGPALSASCAMPSAATVSIAWADKEGSTAALRNAASIRSRFQGLELEPLLQAIADFLDDHEGLVTRISGDRRRG